MKNNDLINGLLNKSNDNRIFSNNHWYSINDIDIISNKIASKISKLKSKYIIVDMKSNVYYLAVIIAIWKVNKIYVPINGYSSPKRIYDIKETLDNFSEIKHVDDENINIDDNIENYKNSNSFYKQGYLNNIAYVIFTSGTTGKPKGVKVTYDNLLKLLNGLKNKFNNFSNFNNFNKLNGTWINLHSFEFDFSIWEMMGSLFYNGKLIMVNDTKPYEFDKISDYISECNVDVLNITPTAFPKLMKFIESNDYSKLKTVIFGGEMLNYQMLKPYFEKYDNTNFFNLYGITEITIHASYHKINVSDFIDLGCSNIGTGIFESSLKVINQDENGVGEIVVSGPTVSDGYIKRPRENEKFKSILGKRFYYSGDLGKYLINGEIEYIGRNDSQVEISGHRIELNDITSNIKNISGITNAITFVKNNNILSVYSGKKIDSKILDKLLLDHIPRYMMPAKILYTKTFPITPNGKIDKKEVIDSIINKNKVMENNEDVESFENWLLNIINNDYDLDINNIDLKQSFIDIGLTSFQLIDLYKKIIDKYKPGTTFSIADLFNFKTISEFQNKFKF